MPKKMPPLDRFLEKVDKTPGHGPNGDCWLWIAKNAANERYGRFWLNGTLMKAHRASYTLFCGPIPDGLNVLHSCDTPLCVNWGHLHLGTQADNIDQAIQRQRWVFPPKGEQHNSVKLTLDGVIKIKQMLSDGVSTRKIAGLTGMSRGAICHIKRGKSWRGVVA